MNTGERLNSDAWLVLTYAAALPLGLWFLASLALRRIGPWKGDPRAWKLAGILVGSGIGLLFVLMFVWAFGLQEGDAASNANARIGLAVAVLGLLTLGFLAYRLDRSAWKIVVLYVLGGAFIASGVALSFEQAFEDGFWPVPFGIALLVPGAFLWSRGTRARLRLTDRREAA